MKHEVVNHLTLSNQVYEIVRDRILAGYYKPGEQVKESEIASEFEISRGPVREAMRQLGNVGLVQYVYFKGSFVSTMDPKEAWKLYVLRANLEVLAIKFAPHGITDDLVDELESLYKRMIESDDLLMGEIVKVDLKFHQAICRASDNPYLEKLWESLNGYQYSLFYTVHVGKIRDFRTISDRHKGIMAAVRLKDEKMMIKELQDHYLSTASRLLGKDYHVDFEAFLE